MNRAQRRDGKVKRIRTLYEELSASIDKIVDEEDNFLKNGDRVMINVDHIMCRSDYHRLQKQYKNFVESSRGKVFTVRLYRARSNGFSAMVELVEEPKWLFWYGDLIKVDDKE